MEEDKTFGKFYVHLSNLLNSSYYLRRHIDEEKQIEKILASYPHRFDDKVTTFETFYKSRNLIITKLFGDLQACKMHHFLSKKA